MFPLRRLHRLQERKRHTTQIGQSSTAHPRHRRRPSPSTPLRAPQGGRAPRAAHRKRCRMPPSPLRDPSALPLISPPRDLCFASHPKARQRGAARSNTTSRRFQLSAGCHLCLTLSSPQAGLTSTAHQRPENRGERGNREGGVQDSAARVRAPPVDRRGSVIPELRARGLARRGFRHMADRLCALAVCPSLQPQASVEGGRSRRQASPSRRSNVTTGM
jgi:hypothetical protein